MTLLILYTLFAHFVADFIFQDEKWATTKSFNNLSLLAHVSTYTLIMSILMLLYLNYFQLLIFAIVTFISHGIVDYITSRIVKRKFDNKQYGSSIPNFGAFTTIGFDQWIHYFFIFTTLRYLALWS